MGCRPRPAQTSPRPDSTTPTIPAQVSGFERALPSTCTYTLPEQTRSPSSSWWPDSFIFTPLKKNGRSYLCRPRLASLTLVPPQSLISAGLTERQLDLDAAADRATVGGVAELGLPHPALPADDVLERDVDHVVGLVVDGPLAEVAPGPRTPTPGTRRVA